MNLEETKEQLLKWFWEGSYTSKYKEEDCISITKEGVVRLKLYTNENFYSISATPPGSRHPDGLGYLGCIAKSRKPRAGETWTRGNDLPDGYFCYETWIKILGGIVGYELVKIHGPRKEIEDMDEPI